MSEGVICIKHYIKGVGCAGCVPTSFSLSMFVDQRERFVIAGLFFPGKPCIFRNMNDGSGALKIKVCLDSFQASPRDM